ncbi:hypothetical protein HDU85_000467 [Gaertneriomyces sp. JEL0708]|nr:hypothetical protein HDU85_000467 [Gaertneriomyces sp. JEL0708]
MAGGNPLETYNIAGMRIPRYKVALYGMIGYTLLFTGLIKYKQMQPPAPIVYDSPEEESYVKRYIKHMETESHKPHLLREPYRGTTY